MTTVWLDPTSIGRTGAATAPTTPRADGGHRRADLRTRARRHATVGHDRVIEPNTTMTVDEAMALVQEGDRSAFATLYDALAAQLFGAVRRVLRDPAMSEEVTQEVFLEIWRTAPRFDPARSSVSTWAITIARRRAVDRVRHEQSRRDRTERHAAQADPSHEDSLDETVVSSDEAERVHTALAALPPPQRDVIRLAFLEGHAHGEIARRLDLPLGTVKGRVRGGLRRLRNELEGPTT